MSALTREQRLACNLALSAQTPGEIEAAHVLMVRSFPKIAAAYPCDCSACEAERQRAGERRLADDLYEDALRAEEETL